LGERARELLVLLLAVLVVLAALVVFPLPEVTLAMVPEDEPLVDRVVAFEAVLPPFPQEAREAIGSAPVSDRTRLLAKPLRSLVAPFGTLRRQKTERAVAHVVARASQRVHATEASEFLLAKTQFRGVASLRFVLRRRPRAHAKLVVDDAPAEIDADDAR